MIKWLLVLVTVSTPRDFGFNILSEHGTISECHVASTYIHWEEQMPINTEALCIRVEE